MFWKDRINANFQKMTFYLVMNGTYIFRESWILRSHIEGNRLQDRNSLWQLVADNTPSSATYTVNFINAAGGETLLQTFYPCPINMSF